MPELEEQLNRILGDADAMARITALADQLTGKAPPPEPTPAPPPVTPPDAAENSGDAPLIDPQLLSRMLPLLRELGHTNARSSQLLYALQPYLKEERRDKVERAVRLAHVICVAKEFIRQGGTGLV